ncbi:unannotated protein [freshwater metagenome]|uniref:Unannotated protein n=1 Tax=freshwater metagenome TaxID=449393 RepID=A0A6J7H3A6_9ZZZZ|nr:TSUP family transporter [Actinomycetota bacterium]
MDIDLLIVAFGLGVGILVGTTGMGGGSIMTPLLILVVGTAPAAAIGTDLAYAAVTKTVGGWRHLRAKTVDIRLCIWLGFGSVPGAVVGVWLLHVLQRRLGANFDDVIIYALAGALLLTAAAVLARALFIPEHLRVERESSDLHLTSTRAGTVAFGFVVGVVLGTTSAGSGALIALGLILFYKLSPRRVVGTDVAHAAILLWVASIGHMITGNVDYGLAGNILIGSIPGVWIGAHLATRLPTQGLRPLLGVVLLAAGLGLLTKAGVAIPPVAIVGAPAAAGLAAFIVHRLRPVPVIQPEPVA